MSEPATLEEMREMIEIPGKKYSIGKYQVTQSLWESVMGNNPSDFKANSRPVECVSWLDCILFCNKLSESQGLEKAYLINGEEVNCNFTANGYRLPTEWEWWFAAKANQDSEYIGGDDIDDVGWYDGNSNGTTHNVGQKQPNGFGMHDMSGNVWEWCWDWFEGDSEWFTPVEGSTGPDDGSSRVNRGGSWFDDDWYARVSFRYWFNPSYQDHLIGFRLAQTLG